MKISISGELYMFFSMFALGALEGILFDILRVLREFLHKRAVAAVMDVVFLLAAGNVFGYFVFKLSYGEIRLYMLLTFFGGLVFYFLLLSKPVIFVFSHIMEIFLKIFKLIFKILLTPAAFLYKILVGCFFEKIRFFLCVIKRQFRKGLDGKKRSKNDKET